MIVSPKYLYDLQLPFTPISLCGTGKRDNSELEGPTPSNTYGFKVSQSALPARSDSHQVLTLTYILLGSSETPFFFYFQIPIEE